MCHNPKWIGCKLATVMCDSLVMWLLLCVTPLACDVPLKWPRVATHVLEDDGFQFNFNLICAELQ